MQRTVSILLALAMVLVFVGYAQAKETVKKDTSPVTKKEKKTVTLNVKMPDGAPTISMLKLLKDSPVEIAGAQFNFKSIKSPELMASLVMSGEADFAVAPTNLAAKLYNRGAPITLLSTSVWGVLYLVSHEEIADLNFLKGKEIYLMGRGLTPDVIVRHLLIKNDIDPDKDIKLTYLPGAADLASAFLGRISQTSLMLEPMLSSVLMRNKDTNIIFDLQKEWEKVTGLAGGIPQASLIVRNEVIRRYPEIVEKFLKEYKKSIEWVNANPVEAGRYAEKLKIVPNSKIIEKAIPRLNLEFVSASDAKERLEAFFTVLMNYSKESVGGKLPDAKFYFRR